MSAHAHSGDHVPTHRRRYVAIAALTVVSVAATGLYLHSRQLTADELMMVGRWYGYRHDREAHYAWIIERRANRTCAIHFENFHPHDPGEAVPAEPAGTRLWDVKVNEEIGRWWCRDRIYASETWSPGEEMSLARRLVHLVRNFAWAGEEHWEQNYQVRSLSSDAMDYDYSPEGIHFRVVRVRDDFQMPDTPMSAEDVMKTIESGSALQPIQ